jgi:arylsulfatase A-like enzyme
MEELPFTSQYPKDGFTIAKGLKAAGYTTGYMGKWHLSIGPDGNYLGVNPEYAHLYGFDYAPPYHVEGRI